MKNVLWMIVAMASCLSACRPAADGGRQAEALRPDTVAVRWLQGIWMDDASEVPVLKVKGDSIYFADRVNVPLRFEVLGDTLVTYGAEPAKYPIAQLGEHHFSFYTAMGDLMSLRRLEADSLTFGTVVQPGGPVSEVLRKDSVIVFQGVRYRGYVYINPTQKKVVRPAMTEEGLLVDNVYYDNVIHICVYEGKRRLFGKDIRKEMLADVVPADFLQSSVLSDMDFIGVTAEGYRYSATICTPDAPSCYFVEVDVSRSGDLSYHICTQ
ncbi:MAG: DUF4738 domain-containing protein [Coriobacteriales bacterium]